ncbi:MAG TPA: hypothetical protein VN896_06015 [Methylomirabilota bacterium]|jgi:hypothetical protein|nr:hypothetical protein [Methylomirabilota bacterium]
MRLKVTLLVALLVASSVGTALAQQPGTRGIEITPLFGYRWGGGMSTIPGIRDFDTKDNISYGVALVKRLPRNSAVDINWTHFSGDIEATTTQAFPGSPPVGTKLSGPSINRDDILMNGYWYAFDPSRPMIPYFTLGIGASIFGSEKTSTIGRFAWNIGAGLRRELNEKLALNIQGLWLPTWVTTGSGLWCDPWYCYSVGTGEYYDQFELSGKLSIKL